MRELRPLVDFNYDLRAPLSSAAKAKINRYWTEKEKLQIRPHQLFKSRNAEHLRQAQAFGGHPPGFPGFKVAFVPAPPGGKIKVKFGKHGAYTVSANIETRAVLFDKQEILRAIADDTKRGDGAQSSLAGYLESEIAAAPVAKRYAIMAAEFEVPLPAFRETIVSKVMEKINFYSSDKFDPEIEHSHWFGNWLYGVNAYNFHNQKDLDKYRAEKRKYSQQVAREKTAKYRADKYRAESGKSRYYLDDYGSMGRVAKTSPGEKWREVKDREYYEAVYKNGYTEIKGKN